MNEKFKKKLYNLLGLSINNVNKIEPLKIKEKMNLYYGESKDKFVDDLIELSQEEINNIKTHQFWRYHPNVKFFRSKLVTDAINHILESKVPGISNENSLNEENISYKQVFDEIHNLDWSADVFLIGGIVRDTLQRVSPNDVDISVSCPPSDLEKICKKNKWKIHTNASYYSIGEEIENEHLEGKDIYSQLGPGYTGEFCVNSIYYDVKNKIIIDKTGKGINDAKYKILDITCPNDEWKFWFDENKPFRFLKFRLRDYDSSDEVKRYIYTQFKNSFKESKRNRCKILFDRLHISKDELLKVIERDLVFVISSEDIDEFIKWYRDYIYSLD